MLSLKMKYGSKEISVSIPKKNYLGIIEGKNECRSKTEEQIINHALDNPISSKKLEDIVSPGESVCIVISDITRAWQKMSSYLPHIVERLNNAGIKDEDIVFLSATGSHRKQTAEEHKVLLGDLSSRFKVTDHDCMDNETLAYLGKTSFGTPVYINKLALSCDHVILTGAIVFHDLAGWSGGKKSLVPGISGFETIMANHSLSLNSKAGEGINTLVRSGNILNNPVHLDMEEASEFAKPSFILNVVVDGEGNITNAVAGDYIEAHRTGCNIVDDTDRVLINEKADLVIASAGGFPKDIDLYQTSKAFVNACEAVKEGGAVIVLSECLEGVGSREVQEIIANFQSNDEREMELRRNFTIAKYTGYLITVLAEKFEIILISGIGEELVKGSNIQVAKNFHEAMGKVHSKMGDNFKAYLMPSASSTLPVLHE